LWVFEHEGPYGVGPTEDAGVAAGAFLSVAHVVDDHRVGHISLDEHRVEVT
jgi:hypothetical protein